MSTTAIPTPSCPYCGCVPHQHVGQCPNVKEIDYFPDGHIKQVVKHSENEVAQNIHLISSISLQQSDGLADLEQAYQQLELRGVPRGRARSVSNGIEVLAARYDREIAALRALSEQEYICRCGIRVVPHRCSGMKEF